MVYFFHVKSTKPQWEINHLTTAWFSVIYHFTRGRLFFRFPEPAISEHFCLFHRLLEIRYDVFGIFQADAEAEEALPIDFGIMRQFVAGFIVVNDQAFNITE